MERRWMTAAVAALLLIGSSLSPAAAATASQPPPAPPAEGGAATDSAADASQHAEPQRPGAPQTETQKPEPKPQSNPAPLGPLFRDLPVEHWAYPAIEKLIKSGIIKFDPAGNFRPDDPVSRAELLKLLLEARKIDPARKCAALFADVDCSAWYAPYVEFGYRLAILEPDGNGLFHPDGAVTRQELLMATVRSMGKRWAAARLPGEEISNTLAPFSDRRELDWHARGPVAFALQQGLTAGFSDGTLRPNAPATRAEAAVLASRILLGEEGLQAANLDGHEVLFTQTIDMVASMYTTDEHDVGTVTYTGVNVRTGAVAVDPSVIPLGSFLYVEGYGYAVAVDIGGAVKGNRIDLFSWATGHEASLFGLQSRKVWILP